MFTKRKSYSNSKTLKDSINNSSEDEQIKQIIKEINRDNRNTFFFQYKSPTKIRSFIRNRSTMASSTIRGNNRNSSVKETRENSLSFKLKGKITKETLILELRQELKYHIKFNAIYNNLLKKIIHLKEMVKENKDKVEQNTELLKETFRDRFNIIDQYEKTMILLNEEKKDIVKTNKEIIKMRQQSSVKLKKEFNDIQIRNSKQREKIEILLNEELQKQLEKEEKKYEEHLKMYKALLKKYEYFLDEYNTFLKCGDEITKVDVKLFDDTNAKNYLIEENLEVELNEKLIKKSFLMSNINNLKLQIKFIEEKQQEEKLREEKKVKNCNLIGLNKRRTTKNKNTKNKTNSNIFKKSLSYTNIFSKNN